MYRIRSPYRDALNELASSFPAMKIVDIMNYADDLFLDHCHLLPDGHKKLASDVCDKLVDHHKGRSQSVAEKHAVQS